MTDERDDEILGRALARAVETQDVAETPYDRSRLAVRPLRRGLPVWRFAAVAAAVVLAAGIGSWAMRSGAPSPVAASPTPAATGGATGPQVATAAPASSVPRTEVDHRLVYVARAGLPPISVALPAVATQATPEERTASRITALRALRPADVPRGGENLMWGNAFQGGVRISITGDVVNVDLTLTSAWSLPDRTTAYGALQALVYTATEEPGIRRVVLTQNNGAPLEIGDLRITTPLSREDVFGYRAIGPVGRDHAIESAGSALPAGGQRSGQMDTVGGLGVKSRTHVGAQGVVQPAPAFVVWMAETQGDLKQMGKYVVTMVVGATAQPSAPMFMVPHIEDQTPLRATLSGGDASVMVSQFVLDDARPWRAYVDQGDVVVEIGGDPRVVSDRIALADTASAQPGLTLGRTFPLAGSARVFEANVVWRVKDSSQRVVAAGHTTASIGTSALWGTFTTQVTLPANVSGDVTLEVYEVSPKDGSEQGLVAVPHTIR